MSTESIEQIGNAGSQPASRPTPQAASARPPHATLETVAAALRSGRMIPYLGPDVLKAAAPSMPLVPLLPEDLAAALNAKVAVPGRIRNNLWQTAQFIESRRHRKTLTALMAEIFRTPVPPTALHRALAKLPLPLIVDTWYDGAMRTALAESGRTDWGEVQGTTRAHATRDIWTKAYDASGTEVDPAEAAAWTTVLYKPHGSVVPDKNFLVSDSDYVEVLTEIDIQTPIPAVVQERRHGRAFAFVGARFHEQTLRIFAHQITKRAAEGHVALVEPDGLTRNESRFLAIWDVFPLAAGPAALADHLA
ncbi:SIR2 family NAD-dependent protein deacylase [Rhodovulum sp. PH10]|uniref:SIR2 family NAD-dependent protein deacylase n=1 Tax=Rhodovulum sp. PH10 TaxID=1187851 RepID=UPI000A0265D1|nr:SIR2 family protein [Rhodovulum sp. PH10]